MVFTEGYMGQYRGIIFLSFFLLLGLTPVSNEYSTNDKIEVEFKNLYGQAQDKQFDVFTATPTLTAIQDGQIVVFRTGDTSGLMFRSGQEIYKVNASCVTVTR